MLHLLYIAQSQGMRFSQPAGTEEHVNENRLKTFIELTRQALEEDRVRQADLSYHRRTTLNDPRPDRKVKREGLGSKG